MNAALRPYPYPLVRQLVAIVERDAHKSVALLDILAKVKEELGENEPLMDDGQSNRAAARQMPPRGVIMTPTTAKVAKVEKVEKEVQAFVGAANLAEMVRWLEEHPASPAHAAASGMAMDMANVAALLRLGVERGVIVKAGRTRGTVYSAAVEDGER